MARFLFCSFALVLLYPSGIDMYLVGLPHIARDLVDNVLRMFMPDENITKLIHQTNELSVM